MTKQLALLVGTPKGAFVVDGDATRSSWTLRGPLCEGWAIHDVSVEPETGALLAGGGSAWYGPGVWRSEDLGRTWTHSGEGLTYGDDGPKLQTVWNVTATDDAIYAGVQPAGLFRSRDRGQTWEHVEGLTNHPTRGDWQPGAGGLILHSIVPHREDPDRLWVGISSVGVFETRDGGATWATRNKGVRAGFQPEIYPEYGQCVHKLVMAADGGEHLYQQNHCGVYRSTDGGAQWEEITPGLPSEFGFPMTAHPRDPQTVWTIPLNGADQGRFVPGRVGRRVAHARRRGDLDPLWRRAAAARRLPPGAARGDGQRRPRSGRHLLRDQHRPAVRQRGRGPFVVARRRQPAADLVRGGRRRWLTNRACAIVHLPRSLIALFPGTSRRVEAHGSTVAEVIADLDRQVPGIGIRVLDAGPSLRAHLNVFVAGDRAGLATPVPNGADVHIIPAVSGG